MRATRHTPDEQYQLIMECCSSGLSDYQWCTEHGINPGTFYNWVKRLRKTARYDIPSAASRGSYAKYEKQDVVKLEILPDHPEQMPSPHNCFPRSSVWSEVSHVRGHHCRG